MCRMTDFLDFNNLRRRSSPNQWLVGPADFRSDLTVDRVAAVFKTPAKTLAEKWVAVLKAQSRTIVLGVSDDGLSVEAQQRSALLRFVDVISFRAIPIDDESSTFVAYSRSNLGYWDVGVNQRRLTQWVDALQRSTSR